MKKNPERTQDDKRRRWVPAATVRELLATATDPSVLDDLRRFESEELTDPNQQ